MSALHLQCSRGHGSRHPRHVPPIVIPPAAILCASGSRRRNETRFRGTCCRSSTMVGRGRAQTLAKAGHAELRSTRADTRAGVVLRRPYGRLSPPRGCRSRRSSPQHFAKIHKNNIAVVSHSQSTGAHAPPHHHAPISHRHYAPRATGSEPSCRARARPAARSRGGSSAMSAEFAVRRSLSRAFPTTAITKSS